MNTVLPKIALGEVLSQVFRPEVPMPSTMYRQLGVKLWGVGAYERESIDGAATKYATLSRVEADDIVVNKIWARNGSVAVVAPTLAGCFVSGEFPTFVPNPKKLLPRWVHWLTKTADFWMQCDEKSRGTSGQNRIKPEQFLKVEIPLPLLREQRRIVARIEELAAKIAEARSLRHQAVEEVKALAQRGGEDVFDRAVEEFPLKRLEDCVEIRGGGTPSKANPFFWQGNIPWVTPKDMKVRSIHDSMDHISEQAVVESPAKLISPGAVLVVVRGMILAHTFPSAVLKVAATINQDMKALVPRSELLPEYLCSLFWAYNSRILESIEKSTHDTRKLQTPRLLETKISVPPLVEQQRIVAYLDGLHAKVNALKRLQAETAAELDALLPSILDRAFKGEL